jgi:hypothetical protein
MVSPTALTSADAAAATWASGAGFALAAGRARGFAAEAFGAGVFGAGAFVVGVFGAEIFGADVFGAAVFGAGALAAGLATTSGPFALAFEAGCPVTRAGPALRGAAGFFGVCAISGYPFVDLFLQMIDRSHTISNCHISVTNLWVANKKGADSLRPFLWKRSWAGISGPRMQRASRL